jgi:hypothetical protein
MQDDYELPRLKEKDTTQDLLKQSLVNYQTVLLSKLEENRKYRQIIDSNMEEINQLNIRISYIEEMLHEKTR